MASGFNQPFFRNTFSGPTDRETNRWDRLEDSKKSAYAVLY